MVVSAEAREYRQVVAYICNQAGLEPSKDLNELTVKWYRKRKSGDLSNKIKVIEDALQGFLYVNDSQIDTMHLHRFEDKKHPRIEVSWA